MKRNDIVMVELPPPSGGTGREQSGRRPAMVAQDDIPGLPTLLVVPFTSQLAALRFPHTLRVDPSPENGLSTPSVLLLFQLQVVDKRRILRVVGEMEPHYVGQFEFGMRQMLKL